MSCYSNQTASGETTETTSSSSSSSIEYNDSFKLVAKLSDSVKTIIKNSANTYGVDWIWLAVIAYLESKFNVNSGNSLGYRGLFAFSSKTMCKGKSVNSPQDQSDCAANNLKNEVSKAKSKWNLSDEDSHLYALLSHNAGNGASAFFMEKAQNPKSISNAITVIKTIPSSQFIVGGKIPYNLDKCYFKGSGRPIKRDEIVNYIKDAKSIYMAIKKQYGS